MSRSSEPWLEQTEVLRLMQRSDRCTVLGPGKRAVLWVQGCPFQCPGCIVPESQPFVGGEATAVAELASDLLRSRDIEGITLSGGEPMSQAAALVSLINATRSVDFSWVCYSGYTLEWLRSSGSPVQQALLERLDILIDGPYMANRHTDLRGRGSDNQRVHFLSDRYQDLRERYEERGSWMELELGADGSMLWMGIPPPGFRSAFEEAMGSQGIRMTVNGVLK
jgi:anaerobic ribonucleoside-triphosphate reductase activating protein